MTPTQVWEGYNPVKDPLQSSVQSSAEIGDLQVTEYFFTSETVEDGKVRVCCRSVFKKGGAERKPTVIVLPSLNAKCCDEEILERITNNGYAALYVDYAGIFPEKELHTTFPKSLSFAEAEKAKENLHFLEENARQTPWFIWAKICRRAITMVEESLYADRTSICVLGFEEGAQLAWILAGIDGRLKTVVPVFGGGYTYYQGIPKYLQSNIANDEEQRVWIAGIGAETYSRAVSCPVYFIAASNNTVSDIDRAGDILDNVPIPQKGLSISPRTNLQFSLSSYKGLECWLEIFLKGNGYELPQMNYEFINLDGELFLRYKSTELPKSFEAYISYAEIHPAARDWHTLDDPIVDSNTGDWLFKIKFFDYNEQLFVFVNSTFENGIVLSTPVLEIVPDTLKITEPLLPRVKTSRIIYNNALGLSSSAIESDSLILDESLLTLVKGPFDIIGLTATSGRIVSYKFGKSPFSAESDIVLQMDVYSKSARTVAFNLLNFEDKKIYSASASLSGGEMWQRIAFVASDFKSKDNKSLQTFSEIEKAVFKDAENVLFNNILWL